MSDVREVSIPVGSNISLYSKGVDLMDAYMVRLPKESITSPELLAKFIFEQQVPWVMGLMKLRDLLVKMFRLKVSTVEDFISTDKDGAECIGFFKVYSLIDNEVIMGEDDHHLDFRVSVLYRNGESEDGSSPHVIISTVVLCHNRLGRNYLRLIKPFHRVIVKSGLRRAVVKGFPKQK